MDGKNLIRKSIKPTTLAILSQFPVVSAFATFINEYANSSWQERVEKVQTEIIDKISKSDESFEKKIMEMDNFASLLCSTYQEASKDIDDNKIPLYVNLLINSIKSENISNVKIHIFLNFLRDFSILHIEKLRFFNNSHSFKNDKILLQLNRFEQLSYKENLIALFENESAELWNQIELDNILSELCTKKLIQISKLEDIVLSKFSIQQIPRYTTDLGREFLKFIEEHDE